MVDTTKPEGEAVLANLSSWMSEHEEACKTSNTPKYKLIHNTFRSN